MNIEIANGDFEVFCYTVTNKQKRWQRFLLDAIQLSNFSKFIRVILQFLLLYRMVKQGREVSQDSSDFSHMGHSDRINDPL